METLWVLLLLGLAGVAIVWAWSRQGRSKGEKRELKELVQTWEDEGGNVPDVPTPTGDRQAGSRRGS
jgi:hypothetical protein